MFGGVFNDTFPKIDFNLNDPKKLVNSRILREYTDSSNTEIFDARVFCLENNNEGSLSHRSSSTSFLERISQGGGGG
jgi:hypothetical protein